SHILTEIQAMASRVMLIHRGRVALDTCMAELDRHADETIRLGLTHGPGRSHLEAITGVAAAVPIGHGLWRIDAAAGADPITALAAAALDNDWGLFELGREQHTLEDLFVRLTAHDDTGDAAA